MFKNTFIKIALGWLAITAMLGVLRYKPWQSFQAAQTGAGTGAARAELNVGFLPVT